LLPFTVTGKLASGTPAEGATAVLLIAAVTFTAKYLNFCNEGYRKGAMPGVWKTTLRAYGDGGRTSGHVTTVPAVLMMPGIETAVVGLLPSAHTAQATVIVGGATIRPSIGPEP